MTMSLRGASLASTVCLTYLPFSFFFFPSFFFFFFFSFLPSCFFVVFCCFLPSVLHPLTNTVYLVFFLASSMAAFR